MAAVTPTFVAAIVACSPVAVSWYKWLGCQFWGYCGGSHSDLLFVRVHSQGYETLVPREYMWQWESRGTVGNHPAVLQVEEVCRSRLLKFIVNSHTYNLMTKVHSSHVNNLLVLWSLPHLSKLQCIAVLVPWVQKKSQPSVLARQRTAKKCPQNSSGAPFGAVLPHISEF
jgi:hypothetical protein